MVKSTFINRSFFSVQRFAVLFSLLMLTNQVIGQSITSQQTLTDTLTINNDLNSITVKDTIQTNEISQKDYPHLNFSADSSFKETLKPVNKKKVALIAGLGLSALGASYYYANNAWWTGEKKSFHLDRDYSDGSVFSILHGIDEKYAKNLDKAAHFWGGVIYSDMFSFLLRESNMSTKKAGLYGAIGGMAVQGFIEIKDGFAKNWGFSVLDVTAGTLGSFYAYSQNFIPAFAATDIKISYYPHDDFYFDHRNGIPKPTWDEDYMNMTFWASYNPYRLMRHGEHVHPNWPKWLSISIGIGVDSTLDSYNIYKNLPSNQNKGKGNYEFYIAPDIDFTGIFPKNKYFQAFAKIINRVKFPMPTLRLTPSLTFHPVYF